MDKIVLTVKDADYIANFVRSQIENLNIAYNESKKECENKTESVTALAKLLVGDDPDINKNLEELNEAKTSAIEGIEKEYQEKLEKYEKILMLVMCGSTE